MIFLIIFMLCIGYVFTMFSFTVNSYYYFYEMVNSLSGDGVLPEDFYTAYMNVIFKGSTNIVPKKTGMAITVKKLGAVGILGTYINALKTTSIEYIKMYESMLMDVYPYSYTTMSKRMSILGFCTSNLFNVKQTMKSSRFAFKIFKDLEDDKLKDIIGNEIFTERERPSNMPKILQNRTKYIEYLKKYENIERYTNLAEKLPLNLVINDSLSSIANDLKPFSKGVIDDYFYKNIIDNQMVTINPDFYLSNSKIEEYKDDISAVMLQGLSDIQIARICRIVKPEFLLVQFKAYFIENYFDDKCKHHREQLKAMQETTTSSSEVAMGDNKIERFNKVLDITYKRMLETKDVRMFLKVIASVSESISLDKRICNRLVHTFLYDTRKLTPVKLRELFNIDHLNLSAVQKNPEELHPIILKLTDELKGISLCNSMDVLCKYLEQITHYSKSTILEHVETSSYKYILDNKLQWMRDNDVDVVVRGYNDDQLVILNKVAKGKKINPEIINVEEYAPLMRELLPLFEDSDGKRLVLSEDGVAIYKENVLVKNVDYRELTTSNINKRVSEEQIEIKEKENVMENVFGKDTARQLKKREPKYLFYNQVDSLATDQQKYHPDKDDSEVDVINKRREILKGVEKYKDDVKFMREYDRIIKGGWVPNIGEVHAPYPTEYTSEKELILATAKRHIYWSKITGEDF
ncbi:MAG: hypothetical protein ACRCX2_39215 [Paraclostridium sp.]